MLNLSTTITPGGRRRFPQIVLITLEISGGCRTELGRYIFDPESVPTYLYPVAGLAAAPLVYFTKSAEQGAQTQIYLAASNELDLSRDSGKYFDNSRVAATSEAAMNVDTASWLWKESERLTGRTF